MTDTKQTAGAQIRQELKKQFGATSRQISVREGRYSIDLTIKAEGFNRKAVEKIAKQHESIDRCERTGEILSGGNTFISVNFAHELVDAVTERIAESVKPIFEEMQKYGEGSGTHFQVEKTKFLMMNEGVSYSLYALKANGEIDYSKNRSYAGKANVAVLARYIAQFMLGEQ